VWFLLCEFDAALVDDVACCIRPNISVRLTVIVPHFSFPAAAGVHAFPKSVAPTEDFFRVKLWEVGYCFSQGSENCLDRWVLDAESTDQRVHHCNYHGVSCVDQSFVRWSVCLGDYSPPARLWDCWGGWWVSIADLCLTPPHA
jgi:hypothetical protein